MTENSDIEHRNSHSEEEIARRLAEPSGESYLRDFVYGSLDGSVTTFAIVAGVAGAGLASEIIITLGVANLIADGFSMAAGNYLGIKAEEDVKRKVAEEERQHIEMFPEGEEEEIRQIFQNLGFSGKQLEDAVSVITSNKDRWVEVMMRHEHDLSLEAANPIKAAIVTFISFLLIGAIPLFIFIVDLFVGGSIAKPFMWSCLLTCLGFFLIGSLKSKFTARPWLVSGTETLAVGGLAAAVAYYIGLLLRDFAI